MLSLRRHLRVLPATKVLLVPTATTVYAQDKPRDLEGLESRLYRALQLWFAGDFDFLIVYGGYDKWSGLTAQLLYHLEDHGVDSDRIITVIADPYTFENDGDSNGFGGLAAGSKEPGPDYDLDHQHMINLLLTELAMRGVGNPKTWKITVAARTKEARSYWHSFKSIGMTIGHRLPERRYRFWFNPIFQIMMVIDRIGKLFTTRRQHQLEANIELLTASQTS